MCTIRIGGERSEFLAITILGRSHPDARDYWDGNWVRASVELAAGGFRGEVGGDLRTEELASFHRRIGTARRVLIRRGPLHDDGGLALHRLGRRPPRSDRAVLRGPRSARHREYACVPVGS